MLRFNADGAFADVFINDENDAGAFGHLNRPDGIVFGPDGNLYVTSFQAAPGDGDGIRVYDEDGDFLRRIDYYDPNGGTRVFAQALLFGPEGKLYVPMTSTGEVRVYDVTDDTFTTFGTGTDLVTPGYLTFGLTNPSTLAYGGTSAGSLAVPEPASIALAAFACVGLLAAPVQPGGDDAKRAPEPLGVFADNDHAQRPDANFTDAAVSKQAHELFLLFGRCESHQLVNA